MKIVRGLAIFCISIVLFGSCFDPPQFPIVPEIEFEKISFVDSSTDSLILYIHFKDGDGDLGLDNEDLEYISFPYNNAFFFQENNGSLDTLHTMAAASTNSAIQFDILIVPDPNKGKLVFPRTRKKAGYEEVPAYGVNCIDYEYIIDRRLLVRQADFAVLDPVVRILDTLYSGTTQTPETTFLQIQDTLLVYTNPDHYNIEIDFLVKNGEQWEEFDWRKTYCTQSFDGRFPRLAEKDGALEGTLRYTMNSVGFKNIFSIKTLKLRIQIKDRLLHKSNVIYTDEFRL